MGRMLVALAAIGAAALAYVEAAGYPAAARRLPQLLAVVVAILAAVALAQSVVRLRRSAGAAWTAPDPRRSALGAGFVVLILIYAWLIPTAGYLVATPLMLLVPLVVLRPVGWPVIGLTVVAVTGVIWVIFVWFLGLPVPLFPGS